MWYKLQRRTKTSSRRTDDIEVLLEKLGSLQITNETLDKTTEQLDKAIFVTLVPVITNINK